MDVEALQAALLPTGEQSGHSAVVTALLRDGPRGPEVLLVLRREREGDPWSGHVALPGGNAVEGETPLETAVREAREEVGIDLPACARWLGCLPIRAPANRPGLAVIPHVALLEAEANPSAGEEVTAVVWAPLRDLAASAFTTTRHLPHGEVTVPAFAYGGLVVWGFTHRILTELLELLPP